MNNTTHSNNSFLNRSTLSVKHTNYELNTDKLLELIWLKRPLVFTLPKVEDITITVDQFTDKNYSIKEYTNFKLGLRNDFKALGANFDNILNALSSDIKSSSLDEFIITLLKPNSNNLSSPFSRKDELEILDALL